MSNAPLAVAVSGRGLVDPALPVVRADDEGFTRGRAAFETMRVYDGRAFRLEQHLARLAASAASLGLPDPPLRDVTVLVHLALDAAAPGLPGDGVLRVYWTPGPPGDPARADERAQAIILVSPVPDWIEPARARGQRLAALTVPARGLPWLLPGTKSTSYAVHLAAEQEARRRGADDAVFLSADGLVLEGPVTNVWWRVGRTLRTPDVDLGILPGETRAALLELAPACGYAVETGHYGLDELAGAEEAFTSSSVRELMPVVAVDDRPLPSGPAVPELLAALRAAARGAE